MSSALNKVYDDARRVELYRQAGLRQRASDFTPMRARVLSLARLFHPNRPLPASFQPGSDEPLTRERLATGEPLT